MKIRIITLFLGILLAGFSFPGNNKLIGKWMMHEVIQNDQDVTGEHNPHSERYMVFNEDGTFLSGGRPYGKNTGKFKYNKDKRSLFLDSDAGKEDDSRWKVNFRGDTMYWQGVGTEWADGFILVHVRAARANEQ